MAYPLLTTILQLVMIFLIPCAVIPGYIAYQQDKEWNERYDENIIEANFLHRASLYFRYPLPDTSSKDPFVMLKIQYVNDMQQPMDPQRYLIQKLILEKKDDFIMLEKRSLVPQLVILIALSCVWLLSVIHLILCYCIPSNTYKSFCNKIFHSVIGLLLLVLFILYAVGHAAVMAQFGTLSQSAQDLAKICYGILPGSDTGSISLNDATRSLGSHVCSVYEHSLTLEDKIYIKEKQLCPSSVYKLIAIVLVGVIALIYIVTPCVICCCVNMEEYSKVPPHVQATGERSNAVESAGKFSDLPPLPATSIANPVNDKDKNTDLLWIVLEDRTTTGNVMDAQSKVIMDSLQSTS